jgi:hypothetical protein
VLHVEPAEDLEQLQAGGHQQGGSEYPPQRHPQPRQPGKHRDRQQRVHTEAQHEPHGGEQPPCRRVVGTRGADQPARQRRRHERHRERDGQQQPEPGQHEQVNEHAQEEGPRVFRQFPDLADRGPQRVHPEPSGDRQADERDHPGGTPGVAQRLHVEAGQVLHQVALHRVQHRLVVQEESEDREAQQRQRERGEERVVGHRGGQPPTVSLVVAHPGADQMIQPTVVAAGPPPLRRHPPRESRGPHPGTVPASHCT